MPPEPGPNPYVATNLHAECVIDVPALQAYPALIDSYPHRYLFLKPRLNWRGSHLFPQLFSGVETLEARGWEPVSWELGGGSAGQVYGVVMRRIAPDA
jgi:hypothetical protein